MRKVTNHWDERYTAVTQPGAVAPVLLNNLYLAKPEGRALDLACGTGANALYLAAAGFSVEAWDTSVVAIERLRTFSINAALVVNAIQRDAAKIRTFEDFFDLVVVSRFLDRGLCAAIARAVKPGGLLFYQTHTRTRPESSNGPSNPDYLLEDNELLRLFPGLLVRSYHEPGLNRDSLRGERGSAWLVGQRL